MATQDDSMVKASRILRSSVDLLEVAKVHLQKSSFSETGPMLLMIENVMTQIQDSIYQNSGLCSLCGETPTRRNEDEDIERKRRLSFFATQTEKDGVQLKEIIQKKTSRPQLTSQISNISNFSSKSGEQSSNSVSKPNNSEYSFPSLSSLAVKTEEKTQNTPIVPTTTPSRPKTPVLGTFFFSDKPDNTELERQEKEKQDAVEHYKMVVKAQEAFMILDKDHSGSLDVTELREAFKLVGVQEGNIDEMLDEVLVEMDDDNSGTIDIEEFVHLLTRPDLKGNLMNIQHALSDITTDLIKEHNQRTKDMVIGHSAWLLHPRGKISAQWDLLIAALLILTVFTMPLSMAFEFFEKKLLPLDFTADILFMMDIVKHFNTGYIDEFDFTIMDKKKVHRHYLSGWFVPDVLSSVPIEVINVALRSNAPSLLRASKLLKLLRLSRLTKVFRLLKVTKLGKLVTDLKEGFEDRFRVQVPESVLILSRLLVSLLVLAHWMGCINFMIVRLYNFPDESWVVFANLEHASINVQYSWCFYKALAQLIGEGFEVPAIINTSCIERTPWCSIEHWITLSCLYIGSIFYALLISSISYVVVNMNKGSSNLSMQLWTLNEYLRSKKVPLDIRDRVRNFYRIQFAEGKMYDEEEVLRLLPPNLKDDILSYNQRLLFEQVPLLSGPNTPHALRSRLAPLLEKRVMFAGEKIFEEGAIGIEMFFIVSGIVEIFSQHSTSMVKAISDGCYFGDVAVILGGRRTASTQARTNLVLAVIGRNHVVEIINEFPLVQKYMSYIAEKRRLRLESLDPASKLPPLTPEQLKDEEDSLTKYFVKLDKVNDQDKLLHVHKNIPPTARTFDAFDASFDAPKTVRRFRPEMRKSKSESCLKLPDEDSPKIVTQPRGSRDNGPNNGRKLKPLVSPTRRPGSRDGDRASNKRRSHSSEGIVRKPYMKESSMTGNGGVGFGGIELKDLPSRVAIGEMKSEPLHSREIEFF